MKKSKLFKLDKVFDKQVKKNPPAYVKIDGVLYERIDAKTKEMDLDIDLDVLTVLDEKFKVGGFVNRQEVIRDVLRKAMNDLK